MSRPDLVADIENSEKKAESIQDWWNGVHQRNHPFWLSGTPGPEVWKRLDVTSILQGDSSGWIFRWFRPKRHLTVLNIGVGLGLCTRDLAALGCDVHAFDISPLALQRVTDVATTWLASDAARLPASTFDLALSHLVAQHMTNADLAAQLKAVIRTLKPSGLLAMQYSSLDSAGTPPNEQLNSTKSGSVFRDPSAVGDMVKDAGGEVVLAKQIQRHDNILWHIVHVRRSR